MEIQMYKQYTFPFLVATVAVTVFHEALLHIGMGQEMMYAVLFMTASMILFVRAIEFVFSVESVFPFSIAFTTAFTTAFATVAGAGTYGEIGFMAVVMILIVAATVIAGRQFSKHYAFLPLIAEAIVLSAVFTGMSDIMAISGLVFLLYLGGLPDELVLRKEEKEGNNASIPVA